MNLINFGSAAAENEVNNDRNLLLRGYLDLHGAFEACLNRQHFLVLGRKGSGKTALGQHLLLSAPERGVSARIVNLSDLPFSDFPGLLSRKETWQTGYPTIWRFHLILQLIDSIRAESGAVVPEPLAPIVRALESAGALPAPNLPSAINQSRAFSEGLSQRFGESGSVGLSNYDLVSRMATAVAATTTQTRHILVVDGLDEILDPSVAEFQVLTALIAAASSLNDMISTSAKSPSTSSKVIILCRTDLFERLPGANTAKYLEDCAIELTWFDNTMEPNKSQLVKLLNLKAQVSDPTIVDVLQSYFPTTISGRPTLEYLLDNTRHTPRDFLRVFRHIQKFDDSTNGERIPYQVIRQGLKSYSRWFTSEVRNELSGYASDTDIDEIMNLLRRQGKSQFYMTDLLAFQERDSSELDTLPLMERLFECGAVGMIERDKRYPNGKPRYSFKFRNPNATFISSAEIMLNHGWRRDLSTPFDDREAEPTGGISKRPRQPSSRKRAIRIRGQAKLFEVGDSADVRQDEAHVAKSNHPKGRRASRPEGPPKIENSASPDGLGTKSSELG